MNKIRVNVAEHTKRSTATKIPVTIKTENIKKSEPIKIRVNVSEKKQEEIKMVLKEK